MVDVSCSKTARHVVLSVGLEVNNNIVQRYSFLLDGNNGKDERK